MTNRAERRAAAREGILAAAHRQVAEGGCAATSMASVAARAGVATGSLYRHFPSRAALLAEVVGDALRAERSLLERAIAESPRGPEDRLAAWATTATGRLLGARALMHALLGEPAEAEVEAVRREVRREVRATLAGLLREGADAGAWPPGDAAAQAAAIDGAVQAALVGPLADERLGPAPDHEAETATLVELSLKAIGARPPGQQPRGRTPS